MGYTLVTAPQSEPISLQQAKLHLRLDDIGGSHPDDTLITSLITAVRQFAEQQTRRSLITQTWRYTCDSFPYGQLSATPWLREFSIPDNAICLEKGPITAITSITYTDTSGVTQPLADTEYTADLTGPLVRVAPKFGKVWPPTLPQIGAVQVNFTAGYGDAEDVPQGIKQWMLLRLRALYDNRSEIVDGAALIPAYVDRLLDPYRIEVA